MPTSSPSVHFDDNIFSLDNTEQIKEQHLRITGAGYSRLFDIRKNIKSEFEQLVSGFDHKASKDHICEQYEIVLGHHKLVVSLHSYSPTYGKKKRVGDFSTALNHHRVLYFIQEDWKLIRSRKDNDQFKSIIDFLSKVFTNCSPKTRFSIEHDTGYWHYTYVDMENHAAASLVLERT